MAELQGREAELIALGHQIDATPGPAYARLVALAEASAALPLPAPGHAGREQTLALRGRAIALLMQCRLNRRVAAFLEAPLPQSMPARRDSLDLRGAVWRTLSWHLPVAAKVAYWQNLTAYRSNFPEVADADRAALRQLLHASLALPTHPHTALESFYLRHKLEF